MLRSLVFLLVLGNIVFFVLSAGFVAGRDEGGAAAPDETHQPLGADRIRIVSRGDPPPAIELPKKCFEWNDVSSAQSAEIEKLVTSKGVSFIREETQAAIILHTVFIPAPTGGKVASEKKVAELKKLGVKKFQLVQDGGADRWEISLGVFPTEDEALALLAELKKIGVRSAKQGTQVNAPARYHLRVNGPSAVLQAAQKLPGLGAPSECPANTAAATQTSGAPRP